MHIVVSYYDHGHHKRKEPKGLSLQQTQKSYESNSITKRPSIRGKNLHQYGLKHTIPPENIRGRS
jgi:hypothetical protein